MGFQGAGDQRQVRLLSAVSIVVRRGRAFVSKRVLCVRLCSWFPLMITFALMSGNRTGNEQPVTAAIIFLKIAVYLIHFACFSSCWLLIQITCKYAAISYSCIISA